MERFSSARDNKSPISFHTSILVVMITCRSLKDYKRRAALLIILQHNAKEHAFYCIL